MVAYHRRKIGMLSRLPNGRAVKRPVNAGEIVIVAALIIR